MNTIIRTLENNLLKLKVERRVWGKPPNYSQEIVDNCNLEIKEHEQALEALKSQKSLTK